MSAPNFHTMADFPLIVAETEYIKICPECHTGMDSSTDKCEFCGCDLSEVEPIYDDFRNEEITHMMDEVAAELNEAQPFYSVSVESGYYTGVQFYVDCKYCDMEAFTNEEAREEFGMCRSEMLRKFKVARNTIRRRLYKAKDEIGLDELLCTAMFSNGEAWYQKVDTRKPLPLKVAVKAAIAG